MLNSLVLPGMLVHGREARRETVKGQFGRGVVVILGHLHPPSHCHQWGFKFLYFQQESKQSQSQFTTLGPTKYLSQIVLSE